MEIIIIDEKTFMRLLKHMEELKQKIKEISDKTLPTRLGDWVDSEQVCRMLNISKRTLQNYRDKGVIPYSRIERKMYYKQDDVLKFLESNRIESINNKN